MIPLARDLSREVLDCLGPKVLLAGSKNSGGGSPALSDANRASSQTRTLFLTTRANTSINLMRASCYRATHRQN